jgi:hypothetical protein
VIVHGIEIERDAVGICLIVISRRETPGDLRGLAIEETYADIERAVVVEHPDLGALACRLTFVGIDLNEVRRNLSDQASSLS